VWANAALSRGDRVAATARDIAALDRLVAKYGELIEPIQLDVTDKPAVDAAVAHAHERFGGLDVVVNNAGYGLFGAIEEVTEDQARQQIETNLFGALWVTKAALPFLRAQQSGHIVQVSSIGGVNAFSLLGLYHASKWGLEGFSQALAAEVEPHGIHVTIVEPGGYATEWGGSSAVWADGMPEYDHTRDALRERRARRLPGEPDATAAAILAIVDAESPPLRVFFGAYGLDITREEYQRRITEWEIWDHLAQAAQGGV